MADIDAHELADLIKEWKDEYAALTREVGDACKQLENARSDYVAYKETWGGCIKRHIVIICVVLISFFVLLASWRYENFSINWCKFELRKQTCQEENL